MQKAPCPATHQDSNRTLCRQSGCACTAVGRALASPRGFPAADRPFPHVGGHCCRAAQGQWKRTFESVVQPNGQVLVQTVTPESDAFMHRLLADVGARTGVPALVMVPLAKRGDVLCNSIGGALQWLGARSVGELVVGPGPKPVGIH